MRIFPAVKFGMSMLGGMYWGEIRSRDSASKAIQYLNIFSFSSGGLLTINIRPISGCAELIDS